MNGGNLGNRSGGRNCKEGPHEGPQNTPAGWVKVDAFGCLAGARAQPLVIRIKAVQPILAARPQIGALRGAPVRKGYSKTDFLVEIGGMLSPTRRTLNESYQQNSKIKNGGFFVSWNSFDTFF